MPPAPARFDPTWRRNNLCAIFVLLAVLGCLAALAARGGWVELAQDVPIDPDRARLANLKIDPNTASSASLERLPGIGPAIAKAIVDWRAGRANDARPFKAPQDLDQVPGIGAGKIQQMRPFLTIEDK